MKAHLGLVSAVVAVLFAAVADAAPRPTYVFAKAALTLEAEQADETACQAYVRGAPMPGLPPVAYAPTATAAAGAAFATGLLAGMERAKAERRAYQRCMKAHGYAKLELNATEAAGVKGSKGAARDVWFTAFLTAPGLAERVAAARAAVSELPEAPQGPYAFGGLQIDPLSLKLADAVVLQGQGVFTGRATHRSTAQLDQRYSVSNALGIDKHAETGAVFHAVDGGPADTRWCGPFVNNSVRGVVTLEGCIYDDGEQFLVNDANGQPWLAMPGYGPGGFRVATAPALRVSNTDLIGPMDLSLVADRIGKKDISLTLTAWREDKAVIVWRDQARFDANGRVVVPFWPQSLVLQREGDGVRATFQPGGDGRGPESLGAP